MSDESVTKFERLIIRRGAYDPQLLTQFYDDLLYPSFEMEPHCLDSIEEFQLQLCEDSDEDPNPLLTYIIIYRDTSNNVLVGGIVLEHYTESNFVLISYITVRGDYRNQGIAFKLLQEAMSFFNLAQEEDNDDDSIEIERTIDPKLDKNLHRGILHHKPRQSKSKLKRSPSINSMNKDVILVLESDHVDVKKTSMDPIIRIKVHAKLGWRLIDLNFIQPPLRGDVQPAPLLLFVHETTKKRITKERLIEFLREYYDLLLDRDDVCDWENSGYWKLMMDSLKDPVRIFDYNVEEWCTISRKYSKICREYIEKQES